MYTIRNGHDRKKKPEMFKVVPLTFEETLALKRGDEVWFHANDGSARRCRVTGKVKTWKTRPRDLSVPVKYGMWESAHVEYRNGERYGAPVMLKIVKD